MVAHLITKYKKKEIESDRHFEIIINELNNSYGIIINENILKSRLNLNTEEFDIIENNAFVGDHDVECESQILNTDELNDRYESDRRSTESIEKDTESINSVKTISSNSAISKTELVNISDKSISFDLRKVDVKTDDINVKKFSHYRYSYEVPLKPNREIINSSIENVVINNCSIEDANFKLSCDEYENATEHNAKYSVNMRLYDVVREKYKQCNNVCVINFKTMNITKKCYILYAFCAFKECCKFKFVLNRFNYIVDVFRNKINLCHPNNESCKVQQRGIKRVIKQAELLYKPAIKSYNEQFLKKPVELIKIGNPAEYITKTSARKIRSQALSRQDKEKDPIMDLYNMKKEEYKDYIQKIAHPLEVYMWSQDSICALLAEKGKLLKLSRNTLFLDATGSLVRKLEKSSKKVFYYALIANDFENQIVLPIAEAILSSHYTYDIRMWLTKLRQFCISTKLWPIAKRVCTDASHAMTNAAISAFNLDKNINDLEQYLKICHEFLSGHNLKPNFIIIQWCSSHFGKIVIKDVKKYVGSEKQSFVLRAIGMAFNFNKLHQCDEWFEILCTLFLSPTNSKEVNSATEKLKQLHEGGSISLDQHETIRSNNEEYVPKTLYSKSPFWKRYNLIKEAVHSRIVENDKSGKNNLYNPHIIEVILKRYCAFLPLWTNIMGYYVETTSKSRISNAAIES